MSGHADFDENASSRTSNAPYTPRHPIPTVQRYQDHRDKRQAEADAQTPEKARDESHHGTEKHGILDSTKNFLGIGSQSEGKEVDEDHPYKSTNHNVEPPANVDNKSGEDQRKSQSDDQQEEDGHALSKGESGLKDTSESLDSSLDPRKKRKNMKHMTRDHAAREVTDPVTHLKVSIHDTTNKELKTVPENEPPPGLDLRSRTGSNLSKSQSQLGRETEEQQAQHSGMEKMFPPPSFDTMRERIANLYSLALTVGMGVVLASTLIILAGAHMYNQGVEESRSWLRVILSSSLLLVIAATIGGVAIWALRGWLNIKIREAWDDEVWDAARSQEREIVDSPIPESTQWLNSLLSSIWPLINPDLFTSLADTLEDVMQASLPKLVRMISVEDLGQGSEAIRILGVRWLPTGAAAKKVSVVGKIKSDKGQEESDRKVPGQGEVDEDEKSDGDEDDHKSRGEGDAHTKDEKKEEGDEQNIAEGMEAEEGDFVNIEVAFSYRASNSGKSLKVKSRDAHLYLAFYLPGGLRFPVWVELRGIVGTMRMRLQLCPDPPFFELCTLTLLGQPKVDLSCVPLTKKGLNIMDLPLISSFVQTSIDAALAEYVAPKSLTLDLKDMLLGDDFKKDTSTRGVVVVRIMRGRDFKAGDPGFGPMKKGNSDAYVAVGWAKFGKAVWSTRVILSDMSPVWDEIAFLLVASEEINAEERLRVQLWDSDRVSADDDLGRIEVDLKELMRSPKSHGKMWDRTDGFLALEGSEEMPGKLDWSVGYFPKTKIQPEQLRKQKVEEDVNTIEQLKDMVSKDAERKLREATLRDESYELGQQKAQMLKSREDSMITTTPPLDDYPTGIFSIEIHNITGLEFEKINKSQAERDEGDETEGAGDLPSAYCTVILNHQTIFRTRTKPKNSKPFYNAGTERLVRDWRSTEVIVSVRDSRVHENDPLLGIVYLPLDKVFGERSQVIDNYPLVGGIGYGRVRISMVFRSIQLQSPKELLGWDSYGTLEVTGPITSKDIFSDFANLRIKLRTSINRGKVYSSKAKTEGETQWTGKHSRPVRLAVRKRYSSSVVFEFRKNNLGLDKTPGFAVLWLKDIPDEEERTVSLPVWRGDGEKLKRAESNCTDEDLGERAGTINVPLRLYRGLGAYHHKLASRSPNLEDVFEVLSTASDNQETHPAMADESDSNNSASGSDSSDDEDEQGNHKSSNLLQKLKPKDHPPSATDGTSEDVEAKRKSGPIEDIKDYKAHSEQLHRRHRGVMQWKVARTGKYLKTKVEHGKDHVLDSFKHHERDPGIETEV